MSENHYQYQRLGDREIRLLELLPGEFSAEIKVKIKTVHFERKSVPPCEPYQALSYIWGSTEDPSLIHVESQGDTSEHLEQNVDPALPYFQIHVQEQSQSTLRITRNLAVALPYLRNRYEPRTFWIDAICINQSDNDERSQQVARMYEIYKGADRVVVWLGEESDDSNIAIDVFNEIGQQIEVDWAQWTIRTVRKEALKDKLFSKEASNAIYQLLRRPWFERLWIIQEMHAADGRAIVRCGPRSLNWQHLCKGVYYIRLKNALIIDDDNPYSQHRTAYRLVQLWQDQSAYETFSNVWFLTRHALCADPRDRIYGLQGLLPLRRRLKVDYSRSAKEIYEAMALHIIRMERQLHILEFCDLAEGKSSHPTWVPRFDVRSDLSNMVAPGDASRNSGVETISADEQILRLVGTVFGCVDKVKSIKSSAPSLQGVAVSIRALASAEERKAPYVADGSMLEAWCRTIAMNRLTDQYSGSLFFYVDIKDALKKLNNVLDENCDHNENYESPIYSRDVEECTESRSLFTTDNGYCGMGSQAIAPGDKVGILLGCRMPLILRPASGSHYEVVCAAHIHGLMDSEALLGPLPVPWKGITCVDDRGIHWRNFLDTSTGAITTEDPRLGKDFPHEWAFVRHDLEEFYPIFQKGQSSRTTWEDPRMTSQALKERGVHLEVISLI